MKTSEALYAAARYIRKHGFSPEWNPRGKCGCFVHAIHAVGTSGNRDYTPAVVIAVRVCRVIGCSVDADDLREYGWTTKRDAAAACEIAADIAAAEGN